MAYCKLYTEFNGAVYFFCFGLETPILGKFGPTNQNCQFKLKFGTYHHFYNILRLVDVLPSFPFTTRQTMRDYYL